MISIGFQSPAPSSNSNASSCPSDLPSSYEYLWSLHIAYLIIFLILGVLTLATLIMYIETVVFFFRNLYNWKPKDKAKWVLAVYPIFCLTAFVSLIVPRSSNVNELIATCYLSICMYQFVTMLIGHYGGAKLMAKKLDGSSFKLSTPPCCCCCKCLPYPEVTRKNIHTVQSLVIQYAVLGPILSYCMSIVWADDAVYENPFYNPSTYMNFINTIASFVALWGMSVTFHFSAPMLMKSHVKPKFFCMQLINVFHNLQSFFFNILIMAGVFKCDGMLNSVAVGLRYHNILLIIEVFILWCIARHYYRDIGDIPIEDQVYVETCNMATNVTGTLLKDLDITSNRSSNSFGPTCARDIIKEEAMMRALTMVSNQGSNVSFSLDNANQEVLRNRRLYMAAEANSYEPVQFRRGRRGKSGEGPPSKQARIGEGAVRTKIDRSHLYKAGGPTPPTETPSNEGKRFRKRGSSVPAMVNTGTGPDTGPDGDKMNINENPMDRHSDPFPPARQNGHLDVIQEGVMARRPVAEQPRVREPVPRDYDPGRGQPGDSWVVPMEQAPRAVTGHHQRGPPAQQEEPGMAVATQRSPEPQQPPPPQSTQHPAPAASIDHTQSPNTRTTPPGRVYSPRPPSVTSSVASRSMDKPFVMLMSGAESAEDSRPPSTVPHAARRAKRAAKRAGMDQSPQYAGSTSPNGGTPGGIPPATGGMAQNLVGAGPQSPLHRSAFQPIAHEPLSQAQDTTYQSIASPTMQLTGRPALSPDQVVVGVDSNV